MQELSSLLLLLEEKTERALSSLNLTGNNVYSLTMDNCQISFYNMPVIPGARANEADYFLLEEN